MAFVRQAPALDAMILQYTTEAGYLQAAAGMHSDAKIGPHSYTHLPSGYLKQLLLVHVERQADAIKSRDAPQGQGSPLGLHNDFVEAILLHCLQNPGFNDQVRTAVDACSSDSNKIEIPQLDEDAMSVVSATSKGSDKSDSSQPNLKARVRLQPQRDAPPPPPATTTASTVNRPEKSPVAITSPLSNAAAATTARVDEATFSKLRQWLKRHRLHKYTGIMSQLSYGQMVTLTDDELGRQGIPSQGARNKMLKCIGDLQSCNEERQRSLAKFSNDIRGGNFIVPVRGLTDLVQELGTKQSTASIDGPSPAGVNFPSEIIAMMNKIFVGIVENNSSDASFKIDDVKALVQLLDLMIRHESFSVDQRTQLFGWRSECEKTILKLSPESEISDLLNRQVALETKADTGKGKQRQRQNRNRPARPAPQVPISRQRTRMDETNANTPGFSAFDDPLSRRGVHCASNSRPWSEPNLVQSINNANADSISQISLSSTGSAGSTESDNLSWDQLRSGVQFLFNAEDERSVNGGRNFGFRRDQDSTVIRRPDNMGRSGSLGAPGHELRQSQVSGNRLPAKARPDSMFADIAAWSEVSKDQRTRSESHLDSAGRANNEYHPFQGLPCYPLDEFGTQSSRTQHRHGPRSQGTDQSRMFNA